MARIVIPFPQITIHDYEAGTITLRPRRLLTVARIAAKDAECLFVSSVMAAGRELLANDGELPGAAFCLPNGAAVAEPVTIQVGQEFSVRLRNRLGVRVDTVFWAIGDDAEMRFGGVV